MSHSASGVGRLGKDGLEHALTVEQANKTAVNRPFWRAFTTTFSSPQLALMWISKFKKTTSERLKVCVCLRGRLRFKWINTEPRDSPNEPHASPPGGFPSAFNRGFPIEPSIETVSRVHKRTVRGVPKGLSGVCVFERERERESPQPRQPFVHGAHTSRD